jgi:hypothetical protein
MGHYDSKVWSVIDIDIAMISSWLRVVSSSPTNFNSSSTTVHDYYIENVAVTAKNGICRVHDNKIAAFVHYKKADGSGTILLSYSVNGGAGWTDGYIGPVAADKVNILDVIFLNDTIYFLYTLYSDDSGDFKNTVYCLNPVTSDIWFYDDIFLKTPSSYYGGYFYNNSFYAVFIDESDDMKTVRFYLDTVIMDEIIGTLDLTLPAAYSLEKQQYIRINNTQIVMDADHLNIKVGNTDWIVETASGIDSVGIMWGYDVNGNYIIKYFVWNDKIWKVYEGGECAYYLDYSKDARCGWEDWINDCVKIYQITWDSDVTVTNFVFKNGYINNWTASFNTTYTGWVANQIVDFYSGNAYDSTWYVRDFIDNNEVQLISPVQYDLNRNFSGAYNAKRTDEMINTGVTDNCQYISVDLSNWNTGTNYSRNYNDQNLRQFFYEMDKLENRQHIIKQDYSMIFPLTPPTGAKLYNSGSIGLIDVVKTNRKVDIGEVNLFGKNGAKYVKRNASGKGTQNYYFPNAPAADLPTIAANILAQNNIEIITAKTVGFGFLQYGYQYEIDYPNEGITGLYYLYNNNGYDAVAGTEDCEFYNCIYQQDVTNNDKVEYVHQEVKNHEETLTTKNLAVSDPNNYHGTAAGAIFKTTAVGSVPSTWTSTFGTEGIVASVDGHNMVEECTATAADQNLLYDSGNNVASGNYSWNVRLAQVNKGFYILLKGDDIGGWIVALSFTTSGTITILRGDTLASVATIMNYSANVWYHIRIEWVQNTGETIYIDGVPIYTKTTNMQNGRIRYIYPAYSLDTTGTMYIDAPVIANDSDYSHPNQNIGDGVCAMRRGVDLTANSPLATLLNLFTMINTDDNFWDYAGTGGTNNATVVLNAGSSPRSDETNVTEVTGITSRIPDTAKQILFRLLVLVDTVNTLNMVLVKNNDFSNDNLAIRQYCQSVANYRNEIFGIITLPADGDIQLKIGWGAGTISFWFKILGYRQ